MGASWALHIHLLGGFRITYGGEPVGSLDQARLQSLLALLLLHRGTALARQQLAFTFWPDTADKQAHTNLRTVLHRYARACPVKFAMKRF